MDRKPNPPPFPLGARVRYIGNAYSRDDKPLLQSGDIGTVTKVVESRRGTLDVLCVDDEGEEMLDKARDGRSVVTFPNGFTRSVEDPGNRYALESKQQAPTHVPLEKGPDGSEDWFSCPACAAALRKLPTDQFNLAESQGIACDHAVALTSEKR